MIYEATAQFSEASASTLVLVEFPADVAAELISVTVTDTNNDANEAIEIVLEQVVTKGAPAGTSVTPDPVETGQAASGATVLANLTTEPDAYAGRQFGRQGASLLNGYYWEPIDPRRRPRFSPSALVGVRLLQAITATELAITVVWDEIGG